MKTIIIPDVHENIFAVQRALEAQSFDRAVFLGDWFDRFPSQPGDALSTARWLAANQADPNFTFFKGNHDMPYIYSIRGLSCSGHQWQLKSMLLVEGVDMSKFKLYGIVDGFLLSHAGFTPEALTDGVGALEQQSVCAEEMLANGKIHWWLRAGYYRGGDQSKGGCTWLDWDEEFEDIPGVPQIVGHTKHKEPQQKGASWCLDTMMKHYAILEDGNLTIKETPK